MPSRVEEKKKGRAKVPEESTLVTDRNLPACESSQTWWATRDSQTVCKTMMNVRRQRGRHGHNTCNACITSGE